MKVGDQVQYYSPVNLTLSPAEVLEVWDDGSVDLKVGEVFKLRVPVHMPETQEPFLDLRGQRIPLPYIPYQVDETHS